MSRCLAEAPVERALATQGGTWLFQLVSGGLSSSRGVGQMGPVHNTGAAKQSGLCTGAGQLGPSLFHRGLSGPGPDPEPRV